ncbi:MAG: S8 family serine peptidase [Myxococcaceae bacterium]|nr:S8 family serine peptidase [Myxococcaceae bacterium]
MRPVSRWLSSVLVVLVVGCDTRPPEVPTPPPPGWTLKAPERVVAALGAPARFSADVSSGGPSVIFSVEGLPAGVSSSVEPAGPSARAVVTLTAAEGTAPTSGSFTLRASADGAEQKVTIRLDVLGAPKPPTRAPEVTVTMDSLFYAAGTPVGAVVDFGALPAPPAVALFFSSTDSLDVERVVLERGAGNTFRLTTGLPTRALTPGAPATPNDGTLELHPGDSFYALYFVDAAQLPGLEVGLVSDVAFLDGPARPETPTRVDAALALTPDEASARRPIATLLRKNELPLQFAAKELIATPVDQRELDRVLSLTQGRIVDQQPVGLEGTQTAYLLEVPTDRVTPERLSRMRHFLGEPGELAVSRAEGLGLYGLVLLARLEGLHVTINPRLQGQAAPTTVEGGPLNDNMKALGRAGDTTPCLPGADAGNPCIRNVPALWTYLALMDRDTQRVRVGVLDYGFAPNADFRRDADGGFRECDMTSAPMRCGPGAATAAPNAGAFGGERVWHGTGSVTAIGGVVNDGFGGAGTGGQVAVPMMYRYDNLGFVFGIGRGVRQAVDDGASVINISAGYPCNVAVNVGPDLDLCTPLGRATICGVVSAGALGAAALVCSLPLPDFGISCAVATGGAATAVSACVGALQTNFALGDPRDAMRSGIVYAQSRGVPVVVSAGNAYSSSVLPEVIRDYVNLSDRTTNRWGVVPAMFPEVIAVGAVDPSLDNDQFYGPRVDVWAPNRTRYLRPMGDVDPAAPTVFDDFSGTSDASPYTAGVVAAMQAVNPALNPQTPGLSAAERRVLTERVRAILRETSWTNAQLVRFGYRDQPVERPRLINPLAAVKLAGRGVRPDLLALGYDDQLNFDEALLLDDTPAQARELRAADGWKTGSIVGIGPTPVDVDFFRVPGVSTGGLVTQDVRVRVLGDASEQPSLVTDRAQVQVQRVSITRIGDEWEAVFRLFTRERDLVFGVTAAPGQDFVYRLRLEMLTPGAPTVSITDPVAGTSPRVCLNQSLRLAGTITYPPTTFTETAGRWSIDGLVVRTGSLTATPAFQTLGLRRVTFDFGGVSDSVMVEVVSCAVVVRLVTPAMNVSEYPPGSSGFLSVPLVGEVRDGAGMLLPSSSYTFEWVTDRADVQPGGPTSGTQVVATGASVTGAFYAQPGQVSTEHRLVLVVKQGGVEVGRSNVRLITVLQLI